MTATVGEGTEAVALPARPVCLRMLVPERRDAGEDGDVMTPNCTHHIARQEIVEGDGAAARCPCREQLVMAIIEGKRENAECAVAGRQGEVMSDADRAEPQVGV